MAIETSIDIKAAPYCDFTTKILQDSKHYNFEKPASLRMMIAVSSGSHAASQVSNSQEWSLLMAASL